MFLGQIVLDAEKTSENFEVDLSGKASGIYHVQIIRSGIPAVFKVIKQ